MFLGQAVRNEMSLFIKISFSFLPFQIFERETNIPRITQALKCTFLFSYLITDLVLFSYIHYLDLYFIYKYTKSIVKGHFQISV